MTNLATAAAHVPNLVSTFAGTGNVWQPVPKPPSHVVVRPQSAYIGTDQRRPRSPTRTLARPSTARASVSPRQPPTPRSAAVPAAIDTAPRVVDATSDNVRQAVPPRRPLTAGGRVANQRTEFKREMANYTAGAAAVRAENPEVGPMKYEAAAAIDRLKKRTPSCPFSSTSRLGILSPAEADAAAEAAAGPSSARGSRRTASSSAAADPNENRKRPQSARCAHRPGRGHWLDGVATGSTITGHYNRFLSQVPGVAAYDIRTAAEKNRLHVTRCVFGTAGRFPGDKRVVPDASRTASKSPRGHRNASPRAPLPPKPPA